MKIGVVCEGITDFIAIKAFVGSFLSRKGLESEYIQIQPSSDNTDDGGWTRVVFWLQNNPPQTRIRRYFNGGLFNKGLDTKTCDVLIIHIDSDILSDPAFCNMMEKKDIKFSSPSSPDEKGNEIRRLLYLFSRCNELTDIDKKRHLFFPAVDASETWCVAAFERSTIDLESLTGQALWDAFGSVLLRSEGKTDIPLRFGSPDKNCNRRKKFCEKHSSSSYLLDQSEQFSISSSELLNAYNFFKKNKL